MIGTKNKAASKKKTEERERKKAARKNREGMITRECLSKEGLPKKRPKDRNQRIRITVEEKMGF